MDQPAIIWGLTDDRAGHNAQTIGLLERLQTPYQKVPIQYSWRAKLPNRLNGPLTHLNADSRHFIQQALNGSLDIMPPKMVVGCGRRIAPILRYIKQQSPETITIYLMWPDSTQGLDLIIVPAHDKPPLGDNIIETSAPLTAITPKRLDAARQTAYQHFVHLPKPWVSVCIGGSIGGMKFTLDDWRQMLARAQKLAKGGSLLITTSRRTPYEVEIMLAQEVTGPSHLHCYQAGGYNPYLGFLACADAICVSGDSLSMCADATNTAKPVFIFTPKNIQASKHTAQHQAFYDRKLARPLDDTARIGWQPELGNNDVEKVISAIKYRFEEVFE
jgi:mitochondrial fission protein ELM1